VRRTSRSDDPFDFIERRQGGCQAIPGASKVADQFPHVAGEPIALLSQRRSSDHAPETIEQYVGFDEIGL
jgi:hypothetical protein